MVEVVELHSEVALRRVRQFFAAHIVGYDARRAQRHLEIARRPVTRYLPGNATGLFQAPPLAVLDHDGAVIAAVHAHPPYEQIGEMAELAGDEFARGLGQTRRTLACLAVATKHRKSGLGRELVAQLEDRLRREDVIHVTGFMDERNGAPTFYESLGYTTFLRNTPVPPLKPFEFVETHPSYVSGQWFHKQLWGPDQHASTRSQSDRRG